MSSGSLFSEIKKHPRVLALVILVHVAVVIMLSINLSRDDKPPMPSAQKHKIINAVVVDANKYDERKKKKKLAELKKIEDKKAAEKKRKKELERKKTAEKKRLADKKKAVEIKRQKEIQLKKKKAEQKKEKQRIAKEKKAKEKKERERKEQQRLEAEKKRKVEEERKRRAEEKAELARSLLEEERRVEEARKAAERAARLQTQRQQYIMQIRQAVNNNWLRPATNIDGQSCDVIITQTMRGDVIDVRLQSCTSDNAFQRSVERAVLKASPLPLPPNPDVYDRKIHFTFKPR